VIQDLLPFVVAGLASGSVYATAGMGLVLTYKTSGIFNFAHGAQAAVGAYVMWDLWQEHGLPWPVAALGALLLAGVVGGLVLERVAYALADKPTATRVVATVGMAISIQGLLVIRYGSATIPMRSFLPTSTVSVAGVNVRYEQIIVVLLALGAAVALTRFFRATRLGVAMQGVVDDPSLVALHAISPVQVRRSSWMIGSCFAAASGALLAPTLGLDATLLTLLVLQAFGAAAIGQFSSLPLTYLGGMVIGVGQELLKYIVSLDAVVDRVSSSILQPLPSNFPFLVLFGVLLFMPAGRLVERGGRVVRLDRPPVPWSRATLTVASAAGTAVLLVVPHVVGVRLPLYTTALAYVILFASLHLLVRTSGQVSLCQMAFAAVGAAAYAHAHTAGLPFALAVLAAGLVAVPVGALIAIPAIRLSGVFLAVTTFGFGILVELMVFPTAAMFGTDQAAAAPRPAGFDGDVAYFYVLLAAAAASVACVVAVRRSRLGRVLRAQADSPAAVAAHGASIKVARTLAFCISAFLAGVAGALLGPVTETASSLTFNFGVSLTLLAVLLISGRRPVLSAFVAASLFIVGPGYGSGGAVTEWSPVVFGVAAIIVATGATGRAVRALARTGRSLDRVAGTTPVKARTAAVGA
jgi:branched-subunit amino acid ABC-type transport system permease component